MADPPPPSDTEDTGARPKGGLATGTPRWVLPALGVATAMGVALLLLVLHLTGVLGPGAH